MHRQLGYELAHMHSIISTVGTPNADLRPYNPKSYHSKRASFLIGSGIDVPRLSTPSANRIRQPNREGGHAPLLRGYFYCVTETMKGAGIIK